LSNCQDSQMKSGAASIFQDTVLAMKKFVASRLSISIRHCATSGGSSSTWATRSSASKHRPPIELNGSVDAFSRHDIDYSFHASASVR
jgi:hypothetical protein